ncbi:DUF6585 family protein [Actinomadura xylanilytica]|uniref:DUF6585 family protein n=1 Tax=Actinomadura xylanilytica TaxID=887459 RepID=UPI00255B19CA|nr:DUF6585 family protein [Actinomadura xylanilytica]MDL4772750.1 hypothetical protein [Actinomadura xylanilytica]
MSLSQQVSGSVLERAGTRGLGEPVRAFDARPGLRRAAARLAGLVLATVVFVLVAAVCLAERRSAPGVAAVLTAAVFAGAAGRSLRRGGLPAGRVVVHLFTGGLVVDEPGGTLAYGWDDLASVTVSGVRPAARARTRWRVTAVAGEDGRVLAFGDELPDVRALGETVAAEVTRRLVPRALEAVEAGETVRFGAFSVDRDGVGKEGERVAWPAVREVLIENGMVTVQPHGGMPGLAAMAVRTPDAFAFAELCGEITAREAGPDGPWRVPPPRR